ncbi:hypothetical protein ACC782_33810 [Rhizobium ruizarguesonis]
MTALYDKAGRVIMVGDVLKVYHFTGARRKQHFMYKQVVSKGLFADQETPYLAVSHLDLTDDFYTLVCNGKHLPDYEIIQSIDCKHADRPRHTQPM